MARNLARRATYPNSAKSAVCLRSGPRRRWGCSIASVLLLVLGINAAQAAIPATERQALLDLYASTNGASWTINTNWNGPPGTECTWYEVQCDSGGNTVTGLVLSQNNLTGMIPPSLNTLIILIKESAVVSAVSVTDLMWRATAVATRSYRPIEPLTFAALAYMAVILPLTLVARRLYNWQRMSFE